ncbi:cell division protein FtsZ [Desulfacinum hydrothermale DSM 13146]|uniref:Cell division protein FtsZ n=1 Tax=Desulfacinum hydrothermale DSM 13146 TaxID=1121390 RepID=A0A1W1XAU8_9BACT|nr:cell division protein FtsZ [Desulfacinum hydrothermale]SMC20963.1 cell division protein FtsZ [Desulfacinum hydrothermale DSM 13146]
MEDIRRNGARIKVLGIGGGGGNAINNMIDAGMEGVEFIAANTDFQVLEENRAAVKIPLGVNLTKGLGAGGDPEMGAKATEEDMEKIREAVQDADMVFVTAGLGGGTGTGGAPIVARVCKEVGALTVAVVTKPFTFEGRVRHRNADQGLKALSEVVDTLISIPNDRLTSLAAKRATLLEMFQTADNVLLHAVKGISDLIMNPGLINVDFADVKTVMSEMGLAMMGTGVGKGENRAAEAAQQAISSPLLEDISIHGARAALINICAGPDLGMYEFEEASTIIYNEVDSEAQIILGTTIDPEMGEELRVTVIATGIGQPKQQGQRTAPRTARRRTMQPVQPMQPEPIIPGVPETTVLPQAATVRDDHLTEEPPRRRSFFRRLTGGTTDEEDWNIPTFIRRQAD